MTLTTAAWMLAWGLAAQAGQAAGPIIDISGAGFQTLPLAVPNVKVLKGAAPGADVNPLANDPVMDTATTLTKVLRDDLGFSGVFRVMDPAGYLPNAQKEGVVLGTFNMGDWINIGATGLVKVGFSREGDQSTLELHLFDVGQAKEALTARYQGSRDAERKMMHRIADDVYRHYTKEPGVARSKVAAVRQVKGRKDLVMVDADGFGLRPLGLPDGLNLLPAWEPDGTGLVFTTYLKGNPDLYRVGADGGGLTRLSGRQGLNMGGVVSPDGKLIAVTLSQDGNSEIYLLDRKGEIVRRLTKDPQIDSSPSWSPDSKRLAFVSARGGTPQVYVMDVEAGDKSARRMTFQGNYNQTPDWSPRGDKIAFTARDEKNVFDIFVVDATTQKIDRLTQDQGNNEEPSWAPNGRLLAFTSNRTGSDQLWVMTPDGAVQKQLTKEGGFSTPTWGPLPRD
ncbi:MAG: PD40 domain-containing protein [Deltaproteobacteria bacterium]|nr:PD40 domain-containing protein [Deltaproteobacteria bacterium]